MRGKVRWTRVLQSVKVPARCSLVIHNANFANPGDKSYECGTTTAAIGRVSSSHVKLEGLMVDGDTLRNSSSGREMLC